MAKMKSEFHSLIPLLEMVRDAEMQKLAIINQKMESLDRIIGSLRTDARSSGPDENGLLGGNFHVQSKWRDWLENRRQVLSLELVKLAADREFQKVKLSIALGRADVVVGLAAKEAVGSQNS